MDCWHPIRVGGGGGGGGNSSSHFMLQIATGIRSG